jgi:hypothetical protein
LGTLFSKKKKKFLQSSTKKNLFKTYLRNYTVSESKMMNLKNFGNNNSTLLLLINSNIQNLKIVFKFIYANLS